METENGNSVLIDSILDEAISCVRNGGVFDVEDYCQRYPELAEDLRVMLPALAMLEKPNSEPAGSVPESDVSIGQVQSHLTDFHIVSEIGRGAMGVVYEAIQKSLGRRVALKVLMGAGKSGGKSGSIQPLRFHREAEIAARLHHTNIVPVFEAGESEGCVYYAMQLIEGANLQQLIASGEDLRNRSAKSEALLADDTIRMMGSTEEDQQPVNAKGQSKSISVDFGFSPTECAEIVLQIAEGLEFAHERGILHRDIKPSNIMLDKKGQAWIADFGLAKAHEGMDLTATGDVVGTIRYLAPERFHGQSDHRSDIYALGLTLYELVERQPAWPSLDRAQLIQQIVSGNGFRIQSKAAHWSGDLRRIVEKSTANDPEQRYQKAGDLADDLRRFLDGRPVLARKQSIIRSLVFWTKRNPVIASLIAAVAALLVGGLLAVSTLLVRERQQSRIADENFQTAFEAVKTYFTTVSDSAELKSNGMEQLRKDLLNSAKTYYESFTRNHSGNPKLRKERADADFLLGRIHAEMGDLKSAVDCFERARDLVRDGELFDDEYRIRLLQNLADANRQLGNWDAATENFIKARDHARNLVEQNPGNLGYTIQLANLNCWLGYINGLMGRTDDETDCYNQASELLSNELPPLDDELSGDLADVHEKLAMHNRRQGRLQKAREHYVRQIGLRKELQTRLSETTENNKDLSGGYVNLSELEITEGRLPQAREALTEAMKILDQLIVRHPRVVSYRDGLGSCQINLGQIEQMAGKFDEAEKFWLAALETYTRLIEDSPAGTDLHFSVAITNANLGEACLQQGRKQDAIAYAQTSFGQLKSLVEQNPDHPEFAEIHSGVGSSLAAMLSTVGRPNEAMEIISESVRTHEQLMALRPSVLSIRGSLANSCINAADAAKRMGNHVSALKYAKQAIELLEELKNENGADFRQSLAAAYDVAGQCLYEIGQTRLAEEDFEESIRLYEALTIDRPDNDSLVKLNGIVHHNLAMNLRESGEPERALKQADLALEKLDAAQKRSPAVAGDYSYVSLERAKTLGRLGRYADAIEQCQKFGDAGGEANRDCATAITAHMMVAAGSLKVGLDKARSLKGVKFSDPRDAIELAAAWALLGKAVADGRLKADSQAEGVPVSADDCSGQAMALIEEAIGKGVKSVALFESIESLGSLREREDYKRLMETIKPESD